MSNSQRPVTVILPRILKSLIACAAAALIGPTLYLSGFLFVELITGIPFRGDILQIGSLLVIPCCLVLTVLIMFWMPTQALMQRLHQTGFVMLARGGFLFGLGASLVVDYIQQTEEQQGVGPQFWALDHISWSLCLYGSILGGLCSGLAWIFRRPDKD